MTDIKWLIKDVNPPATARLSRFLAAFIELQFHAETKARELEISSVQDNFIKISNELKIFSLENHVFPSNPFRDFQCVNFSFIYC